MNRQASQASATHQDQLHAARKGSGLGAEYDSRVQLPHGSGPASGGGRACADRARLFLFVSARSLSPSGRERTSQRTAISFPDRTANLGAVRQAGVHTVPSGQGHSATPHRESYSAGCGDRVMQNTHHPAVRTGANALDEIVIQRATTDPHPTPTAHSTFATIPQDLAIRNG
jgi:hypothetical protein